MPQLELPKTFTEGKTPETWCEILEEMHGIKVSRRSLRSMARASGNFRKFGRSMLLLPHHVDNIASILNQKGSPGA